MTILNDQACILSLFNGSLGEISPVTSLSNQESVILEMVSYP